MANDENKFVPDDLDRLLFTAFPGLVMRKDLTQKIRGTTKAPSYVIEFMLNKYCANIFDDEDVAEGLRLVQEEVAAYIPRGRDRGHQGLDPRASAPAPDRPGQGRAG